MNQEAIEKLKQFQIKNHLSGYNLEQPEADAQADTVSGSSDKPKRAINYPKHVKPLHDRIMSAITGSKLRTAQAITTYCGEERVKVVNMHLGRMMSAGKLVRYTNPASGITRYYTPEEAKAKGYKPDAQPKKAEKRSSSVPATQKPAKQSKSQGQDYIAFLEKRIAEWQAESRKQAHEILELRDELRKARKTREVTGEVAEVMEEVTKLRATVEYLESKLFGGK
jgi:hypothetical protein